MNYKELTSLFENFVIVVEVGRERERSVVGEGWRREGWGRGDYFLFLKGGTHIFKNYVK